MNTPWPLITDTSVTVGTLIAKLFQTFLASTFLFGRNSTPSLDPIAQTPPPNSPCALGYVRGHLVPKRVELNKKKTVAEFSFSSPYATFPLIFYLHSQGTQLPNSTVCSLQIIHTHRLHKNRLVVAFIKFSGTLKTLAMSRVKVQTCLMIRIINIKTD